MPGEPCRFLVDSFFHQQRCLPSYRINSHVTVRYVHPHLDSIVTTFTSDSATEHAMIFDPMPPKFSVPSSSQSHHLCTESPYLHASIQLTVSTRCTTLKAHTESTQGEKRPLYPTFILCQLIIMFMI